MWHPICYIGILIYKMHPVKKNPKKLYNIRSANKYLHSHCSTKREAMLRYISKSF